MAKELNFDSFLDTHSADFTEYLSKAGSTARSEKQYVELMKQLKAIYEKHPKIAGIVDTEQPCELSKQECPVLIEVLMIHNELAGLEFEQVYFKGCVDCVEYLRTMHIF